jgi:hypothetical protein
MMEGTMLQPSKPIQAARLNCHCTGGIATALRKLCAGFALAVATPCHAEDVFIAGIVSAGPVLGESGEFLDITVYGGLAHVLLLGAEKKIVDDQHLNAAYVGVGLLTLLQAHIGASNHGAIYRIKSEIAPFAWLAGSVYPRAADDAASLSRLTFSVAYEDTFKNKGLGNYTFGMGYCFSFNGP